MANWVELQEDLLVLIATRLTLLEDFVAFGGVCTSWRLAMVTTKKNFSRLPQVPWLMLAEEEDDNNNSNSNSNFRDFYSLTKCKIHRVMLPEASGKRCFSSQGWLLTIGKDEEVNLVHPLSRVQIQLPNLTTVSDLEEMATAAIGTGEMYLTFIQRVVLSCSPSMTTSDYVVMVIHGACPKLAFHKKGDDAWTTVETRMAQYFDVIYYEGLFHAVDCQGRVVVCDVNGPCPTIAQIVSVMARGFVDLIENLYLVESLGKLLIVSREGVLLHEDDTYGTTSFQVFELNVNNGNWVKVQSLGDRALFLGYNSSFSVEASSSDIKANCIYFTDDCHESYSYPSYNGGGKDMGIYNLVDGSFEPHFKGDSISDISPPLWVTPSFS
uniref:KIB1-4 beta-propeller domain-containing protein n=1 Tax=Davidia involucrata TaxID=16924 RepID=A0A5B7ALQ3_DAVIN